MKTKFNKALTKLLELEPKEALILKGTEVAELCNCSVTCANYAIQAFKYILTNKS